jgi:hypothetical protein
MHPDLLRALARERHAELLRARQFRDNRAGGSPSPVRRTQSPVHPLRRTVGSALVAAGTRLMAPGPGPADWAVPGSPDTRAG